MPETTKLNVNNSENDCERVKLLADEYLHDQLIGVGADGILREPELSEEEKRFIDRHITECGECFDYINSEKKYLEEIKYAEYIPKISVSRYVMDTIIENKMIVDKPPRRRILPVGFITAAAVVIIIFAASKGGPLNAFMKFARVENADNPVLVTESEKADDSYFMSYGINNGADESADEDYLQYDGGEESAAAEQSAKLAGAPEPAAFAEDSVGGEIKKESGVEIAEQARGTESTQALRTEVCLQNMSGEDFLAINSDLAIDEIYKINYTDTVEKDADIFQNIEIYRFDNYGNFIIINKKYAEVFIENLARYGIVAEEISGIPRADSNETEEYIGIIYYVE